MTRKSSTLLFFVSWACFVLWGMEMAYALAFSMIIALLARDWRCAKAVREDDICARCGVCASEVKK